VAAVRKHTDGSGVDLVFEYIVGEVFAKSLTCLRHGGRMAVWGGHPGEVVPFDIIEFFRREIDLLGSLRATSAEPQQVFNPVVEGRLRPVIHPAFPLAEAAEARQLVESREHFGKLVLVPSDGSLRLAMSHRPHGRLASRGAFS